MIDFLINKIRTRKDPNIAYLRNEPNLKFIERIAEQLKSNEPIIEYHYKDDVLYIINEPASLYHIVNSTAKLEKLANAAVSTKEEGIILDIGANVGIFSYFIKKKFPKFKTFLFEPDAKLVPVIQKNLSNFSHYEIINSAIGDYDGEIEFYYNPDSSQVNSTELEALLPFTEKDKIISNKVPCKTIKTFCTENNIAEIEILKIDIQGSEYKTLLASEAIFSMTNQMLVEVCFLMPDTIPLINLVAKYYQKSEPINSIIMGADLKFSN